VIEERDQAWTCPKCEA